MKKQIAILGSTGSIGTQALEVIEEHPDLYEVYCLTANNKVDELAEQARKFNPAAVVIANEDKYGRLKELLCDLPDIKVYAGKQAIDDIVEAARRYVLPTRRRLSWQVNLYVSSRLSTIRPSFPLTVSIRPSSKVLWARATTR